MELTKAQEKAIQEISEQIRTQGDLRDINDYLMKTFIEKALNSEMDSHLDYPKHEKNEVRRENTRNGHSEKTLKGANRELRVKVPRDRKAEFDPKLIRKNRCRLEGFEEKIIALYSRGMTTRDIAEAIKDLYNADVSHTVISNVTEGILEEVMAWQNRVIDDKYPVIYLDCLVVKVHQDKRVINKAVYLALGINMEGQKELLGLWICENEGSKFWLSVLTELQNRGLQDVGIFCVDGLKGFPDAIAAAYPEAKVQLCIVHMVRNSLKYVPSGDMKIVAKDLKSIYKSATVEEAQVELSRFKETWDGKYPQISKSWERHWPNLITIFDYPEDIRKVIYTTNAIESLNSVIRKAIRNRKIFPNDNSALKLIYLAVNNASKKWTMPIRGWKIALNRFAIEFGDRFIA